MSFPHKDTEPRAAAASATRRPGAGAEAGGGGYGGGGEKRASLPPVRPRPPRRGHAPLPPETPRAAPPRARPPPARETRPHVGWRRARGRGAPRAAVGRRYRALLPLSLLRSLGRRLVAAPRGAPRRAGGPEVIPAAPCGRKEPARGRGRLHGAVKREVLSALMSIRVDVVYFDSNVWNVSSTNPALSSQSLWESPKGETVHQREEDGPVGRAPAACAAVRSDPKRERSDCRRSSRRSVTAGITRPPLPARRSRAHGGRSHCAVIVSLLPQPKEPSLVLPR